MTALQTMDELDLHFSTLKGEPLTKWQTSSFILCTHEIYEELVTAQLV